MLKLELDLDHRLLPAGHDTIRHAIARITPPAPDPKREPPPLDLAIVIDASSSMRGGPLEAAKEATLRLTHELPRCTRLTITSFADDVVVHADALQLDDAGRAEIHQNLVSLRTRGRTNLHAGWQTGCTLLANDSVVAGGRRRHAVLLSDGHANRGLLDPEELARQARAQLDRGVSTSCVGVGDGYSPAQLSALAEHGAGDCHDAENAQEIVEVLVGEVLSLSEVVAENLRLVLDVPEGIDSCEVSGMPANFEGRRLVVSAGAVRAGIERAIVVRLAIPAQVAPVMQDHAVVITGHLEWHDPGSPECRVGPLSQPRTTLTTDRIEPPSVEDAKTVLVAWQAHLVREVTALNRHRDFAGLERLWRDEFEPFRAYAAAHPGTRIFASTLKRMRRRADWPMRERSRKVALDMATKGARQAPFHYLGNKGRVADQFNDF